MELSIYTYGHIDSMFYVLNAIAMLMSSYFGKSLITVVSMVAVAYYALQISYCGSGNYKRIIAKVIGVVVMVAVLLEPSTEMMIYDHVSKKKEKVDNLPLGFALPVGLLETFGDLMTAGFEQAFTPNGSLPYREYGMLFGARLVQEARSWRIRTPEFLENMQSFIERCIMVDSMIGYHYTPQDLLTTDDIWGLVSRHAGTLRQVGMRVGRERKLMSCKAAAQNVLAPAFNSESQLLEKIQGSSSFASAGNSNFLPRSFNGLNNHLKRNIEAAFKSYLGSNASADNLIKQQMMISSLNNFGNINNYGDARANSTQESNWFIAGNLASTVLPMLMTVFKCLVYSSFIFLVPLMLISGGFSKYLNWILLAASFQLWAPLNAVLNMFIELYSSNSLTGIADTIVSFSSSSKVGSYTDKIVAVASGLQISIPFLAFSIMQGGVGGFIHLAGSITGASQSAASASANEVVTGNKSLDNYSIGNQQLYNRSGFKTDWQESYAAGGSNYQRMDGSMERVTGLGQMILQSGIGLTSSSGETSYRQEESRQAQVMQGIQMAESIHQQDLRSLSNSKANTLAHTADFVSHVAQREHSGATFNYEKLGEQGKALQQAVNQTRMLREQHNYGWDQAAKATLEASASGKIPIIGPSISVKGEVAASNTSSQSVSDERGINIENHTNHSNNNVIRASSNSSWAKENNIDTSYSDAVRRSFEEQQRLESQTSVSQQRVHDWHQAQSVINSQGASSSKEMFQEVVDRISHTYSVDSTTAHRMASKRTLEAQRVWQQMQGEDHYVQNLVGSISSQRNNLTGLEGHKQLDDFTTKGNAKIDPSHTAGIKEHALTQGVDTSKINQNIKDEEARLKTQHSSITEHNRIQHYSIEHANNTEAQDKRQEVNQYEKDRMGQGKVARFAAKAADVVTQGGTGDTVGKPKKED